MLLLLFPALKQHMRSQNWLWWRNSETMFESTGHWILCTGGRQAHPAGW